MDAFELYSEKGEHTDIWCCGKCKRLLLSPVYRFNELEGPDNRKSTREAAEACCRPRLCEVCQAPVPKNTYRSEDLCDRHQSERQREENAKREEERLVKAELVTDYAGPFYFPNTSGDWGEGYHSTLESVAEALGDCDYIYNDNGSICPEMVPEFVFCCTSEIKKLDVDQAIEHLCDDGYEDMSVCLEVPAELLAAVAEFNKRNERALTVYNTDYKHKVAARQFIMDYIKAHEPAPVQDVPPTQF